MSEDIGAAWVLLRCVGALAEGGRWRSARSALKADRAQLMAWIDTPAARTVYGVTSQVGHRDDQAVASEDSAALSEVLIDNHSIGGPPWLTDEQVRCVGYAKVELLCNGGSAIGVDLFEHLATVVRDPSFTPRVPARASYGSGDVIPGAHWARSALRHGDRLGRALGAKEGLALINGAFVHVGLALHTLNRAERSRKLFLHAGRWNLALTKADPTIASGRLDPDGGRLGQLCEWLRPSMSARSRDVQSPVSVRALPQVGASLGRAVAGLQEVLADTMRRPSDNPLVFAGGAAPLSQASFLAPDLTLASGQLIEAVLLAMWCSAGRTAHLLSGAVAGIPRDGVGPAGSIASGAGQDPLGLIQWPKLMVALVEDARTRCGRRSFASGASTSHGIEDLWTHSSSTSEAALAAIDALTEVLEIELAAICVCAQRFDPTGAVFTALPAADGQRGPTELGREFAEAIGAWAWDGPSP